MKTVNNTENKTINSIAVAYPTGNPYKPTEFVSVKIVDFINNIPEPYKGIARIERAVNFYKAHSRAVNAGRILERLSEICYEVNARLMQEHRVALADAQMAKEIADWQEVYDTRARELGYHPSVYAKWMATDLGHRQVKLADAKNMWGCTPAESPTLKTKQLYQVPKRGIKDYYTEIDGTTPIKTVYYSASECEPGEYETQIIAGKYEIRNAFQEYENCLAVLMAHKLSQLDADAFHEKKQNLSTTVRHGVEPLDYYQVPSVLEQEYDWYETTSLGESAKYAHYLDVQRVGNRG